MSNRHSHTLLFAVLVATGTSAFAETLLTKTVEKRFDHRQDRQAQRVNNGFASGALTAPEARRIDREQVRLTRVETRSEAGWQDHAEGSGGTRKAPGRRQPAHPPS